MAKPRILSVYLRALSEAAITWFDWNSRRCLNDGHEAESDGKGELHLEPEVRQSEIVCTTFEDAYVCCCCPISEWRRVSPER